jgi:hypothetical protein
MGQATGGLTLQKLSSGRITPRGLAAPSLTLFLLVKLSLDSTVLAIEAPATGARALARYLLTKL